MFYHTTCTVINLLIIVKTAEIISYFFWLKIEKYLELKDLHIALNGTSQNEGLVTKDNF